MSASRPSGWMLPKTPTVPALVDGPVVPAGRARGHGSPQRCARDLHDALELEPGNFVTYALLGDLEVGAGNERLARARYRGGGRVQPARRGVAELSRGDFGS